jgi:4-diphosphocytidyl-2-C-methyl-D-erythritol kinase
VRVAAPAKVNLWLGVGPARADGYHPLATVYHALDLHDDVELERAFGGTRLLTVKGSVDTSTVPTGSENLAVRAVELLAEHHRRGLPVGLHLTKHIPVAGGLAGGSADAAAALVGADLLFELGTPREELLELAGRLGSDVPFCLLGGTATGTGRGEVVEPVRTSGLFWWVVVPDLAGLSTPAVYAEFDRLTGGAAGPPSIPEALLAALADGNPRSLGAALGNDLEAAALSLRPDLGDLLACGRAGSDRVPGALAGLVSGSGPTTLFLATDAQHAVRLAGHLRDALGRPKGAAPFVVSSPAPGARPLARLPLPGRRTL